MWLTEVFDQNKLIFTHKVPIEIKIRRMDTISFNCRTPQLLRLVTFQRTPFPSDRKFSFSNSPAKLATAGFSRRNDASNDEVVCEECGITYGEWEGESPFAVHRVLYEHCPFLSTPSPEYAIQSHPRVVSARRQLFPADDENDGRNNDSGYDSRLDESVQSPEPTYHSVLSPEASFPFPFQPKVGSTSKLFASRRLKTFKESGCRLCAKWAEEGFIFISDTNSVQCVFCAVVFPFDSFEVKRMHADSSPLCPQVLMKDVGNITRADEERIRLKNLKRKSKNKDSQCSYAVSHPQYEEESARMGTYENWPCTVWNEQLQPTVLSQAGFYYTGCSDKVKCFCCGLGLYKWRQGAEPWEQHARHMPSCPHVQTKGQNFIDRAAEVQVLTEADIPPSSNCQDSPSGTGQLVTSQPGNLTLDTSAVMAALTTGRFPTKDILLGQLRAADVNFSDLCKQREVNHQKDTVIQQKDTELQHKDTELQQHVGQLEQRDQVIQDKDQTLQQHRAELQQRDAELQQHRGELQLQREVARQRETLLEQREAELERRKRLMAYQERQIASLQVQLQALQAHNQAGQQAAALPAANNAAPPPPVNNPTVLDVRCKVCLSEESNTIFQPCHHVSCCRTCAQQLVNEFCPVCRAPIRDLLPAYIA